MVALPKSPIAPDAGAIPVPGALAAPTTIVIADDHPLFRGALRQTLEGLYPGVRIEEAGSVDAVGRTLGGHPDVDLVLLDLAMPGVKGFSGLMYLRAQFPDIPVAVVSATEEPAIIRRALEFGASGFIPKSVSVDLIRDALEGILAGGVWTPPGVDVAANAEPDDSVARLASLTPQQVRVLMMLSEGLLNKQIAYELSVSEATVKAHVSAILTKLGVESRTQAVIVASRIASGQWPGKGEG
ncbi:response regulator [Segnochrobactraceae bacterium EtOH-i3]